MNTPTDNTPPRQQPGAPPGAGPWTARIAALVVFALLFGAIDTLLVRSEFSYRPAEAALFLQAVLLWGAFGVLALVPAALGSLAWSRMRG